MGEEKGIKKGKKKNGCKWKAIVKESKTFKIGN